MPADRFCDHCGTALYPDDLYCVGCGNATGAGSPASPPPPVERRSSRVVAALETGAHALLSSCARCGGEVLPGEAYCQSCGFRLSNPNAG